MGSRWHYRCRGKKVKGHNVWQNDLCPVNREHLGPKPLKSHIHLFWTVYDPYWISIKGQCLDDLLWPIHPNRFSPQCFSLFVHWSWAVNDPSWFWGRAVKVKVHSDFVVQKCWLIMQKHGPRASNLICAFICVGKWALLILGPIVKVTVTANLLSKMVLRVIEQLQISHQPLNLIYY